MDCSIPLHVPHQGREVYNLILDEMTVLKETHDSVTHETTVLEEVRDSTIPGTTVLAEVNGTITQETTVSEEAQGDSNLRVELLLRLTPMGLPSNFVKSPNRELEL